MNRKQKMAEFDQGYNITVTGRHVQVTQAMKDYALEKIAKLERLGSRIIDVNVIMDIQRIDHKVEIIMKYGHTTLASKAVTSDMYASIEQAVHKLNAQIKKYRSKLLDHHAKEHPIQELEVQVYRNPQDEEVAEVNDDIDSENHREFHKTMVPHHIVKTETKHLKILTDDEAIMKMDLSHEQFMIYRDEKTRKLKVIYRREDGDYGVVLVEQ